MSASWTNTRILTVDFAYEVDIPPAQMARGNSRAQSEVAPQGAYERSWSDRQDKRAIARLQQTKNELGDGKPGNGVFVNGELNLREEDINELVLNTIGPRNEIADLYDERNTRKSLNEVPFYPQNLSSPETTRIAGYVESGAFKIEAAEYIRDIQNRERSPAIEYVTVDPDALQSDYKLSMGIDLSDDSARRLSKAMEKAFAKSLEDWSERFD